MASNYPNVDQAVKWAKEVIKGKVPACKWVKLACQRHIDDLAKAKTKDFPYKFDPQKAEKKILFIELMPHTKGKWGLQRKNLELEPWQKFSLAMIFGWVKKKNGMRRFREAYSEVPRKNGKSALAAGVGNAMFVADGEFGAEVYAGATTEKQAWEVFRPAKQMVARTPELIEAAGIEVNASNMNTPLNGGRFEPVIGKPGDGAAPSCTIVDEYHEHDSAALYDTMISGMGSREQPLMFTITTAGDNIHGACYDLRDRVINMLLGTVPDDTLWGWMWTIDEGDDWKDPKVLAKANPNFDVSVFGDYLESQQQVAIKNTRKQNHFKTKHLNVWVGAKLGFFNMEAWHKCADPTLSMADFKAKPCLMSLDLASVTDICARVNLFYRTEADGRLHYYCIAPRFYLPSDTIAYGQEKDVIELYQKWVNDGLLTEHDGAEVSFNDVRDDLLDDAKQVALAEVPLDEWGGFQLMQDITKAGYTPVKIPKVAKTFSPAMKELNAAILAGRFHHDGHPILSWMMGNVVSKTGKNDTEFPDKQKRSKKIDGAIALLMDVSRAQVLANVPSKDKGYSSPIMVGI